MQAQDQHELQRLHDLRSFALFDTARDAAFDRLTLLASRLCETPIACLTLVDETRQIFKSEIGLSVAETPRIFGFCDHVTRTKRSLVVNDATADAIWAQNPLVSGPARVMFYAGVPLISRDGFAIGALAVMDRDARAFSDAQMDTLYTVAAQAMDMLELRRALHAAEGTVAAQFADESKRMRNTTFLEIAGRTAQVDGWVVDLATQSVLWSDGVAAIYEMPTGSSIHIREASNFSAPEWRDRVQGAFQACLDRGKPVDEEYEIITATGRRRWVRAVGQAVRNAAGEIVQIQGAVQDITDKKKGEAEVNRLARRLSTTLENLTDALFTLDHDWRFTFFNKEAERILQRKREDVLGKIIWDVFHVSANDATFTNPLHRAMIEQETVEFENFFPPRGLWVEVRAYPSEEGLAVHFRNITDRKNADATLRENEERFKNVARATADAVWDWDLKTNSLWWNDGMQTLFGFAPSEVEPVIESWTARIHAEDRERVVHSIHGVIDGNGEHWSEEYRFLCKNGAYATVLDRGFVIRDERGQAVRMVGGMTDHTQRLIMEEQLQQAQRLEAVGQLTGGVAHDFNNLLTVIQGNAELLEEMLAGQPRLQSLAILIKTAAERGGSLTHRLLAFARRQTLEPKVVDINQLITGMDQLLKRTLREDIDIFFAGSKDACVALIDPSQLEGAVLNLCLNARDALPMGGRITIETVNITLDASYAGGHPGVTPGPYVMIAVSDTGTGIAPEDLERVFDPFFTTKEVGKGTGLGLSMVYGFVKQSNGHVTIYSELGEGTTVKMYLPCAEQAAPAKPETAASTNDFRGAEKILVVEDDDLVRAHTEDQLVALGYSVIAVQNGPAAIEVIKGIPDIDLLFTDVIMPAGMSGPEVAKAALLLRPDLKVLYTSGYTDNVLLKNGRIEPGVKILNKPYRRIDLAQKVRAVLSGEDDAQT